MGMVRERHSPSGSQTKDTASPGGTGAAGKAVWATVSPQVVRGKTLRSGWRLKNERDFDSGH